MNEHGEQIRGILKGITSGGKEEVASSKGRMGRACMATARDIVTGKSGVHAS